MDAFLLQMMWDTTLIRAWHQDAQGMHLVNSWFCDRHHLSARQLYELKRTTRAEFQGRQPVRAFVASGLRALSDRLWDGAYTDSDLVLWLSGSGLDTAYRSTSNGVRRELRAQQKLVHRTRRVDPHAGHRRSDWNVCKA